MFLLNDNPCNGLPRYNINIMYPHKIIKFIITSSLPQQENTLPSSCTIHAVELSRHCRIIQKISQIQNILIQCNDHNPVHCDARTVYWFGAVWISYYLSSRYFLVWYNPSFDACAWSMSQCCLTFNVIPMFRFHLRYTVWQIITLDSLTGCVYVAHWQLILQCQ